MEEILHDDITRDSVPSSPTPNIKTQKVEYDITSLYGEGKAYTDLTGRFPYKSSRGNEYILVGYHHDDNTLLATAIKNREAVTITAAWSLLNEKFKLAGATPNTYIVDNEASKDLNDAMLQEYIKY